MSPPSLVAPARSSKKGEKNCEIQSKPKVRTLSGETKNDFGTKSLENPSIDLGAYRMRSGRSTNELVPQIVVPTESSTASYTSFSVIGEMKGCSGEMALVLLVLCVVTCAVDTGDQTTLYT